jgi:hypothetical protein
MFKKISLFVFVSLLLVSCSSEEEKKRTFDESVSAFVANDNIAGFGHVDIKGILDKADYENNAMLGAFIAPEMEKVNGALDLSTPMYYALQGPMRKDGSPEKTFLFLKVKDEAALIKDLESSRGFMINKADDIQYTEDGDFVLGVKGDMAIVIIQNGEYEAAEEVKNAFAMTEGDLASDKVSKMLATEGDVTMNISLGAFTEVSDSDLKAMDINSKKELEDLAKDSYLNASLRFEPGQLVLETKNMFSPALKEKIEFDGMKEPLFAKKVVDGDDNVIAAMAINMKLDEGAASFLMGNEEEMTERMESSVSMLALMGIEMSLKALSDGGNVKMPGTGKVMGEKGLSFFIDVDKLPAQEIAPGQAEIFETIDYISLEGDNEGARFVIKSTRGDENILKTMIQLGMSSMGGIMGGMPMM